MLLSLADLILTITLFINAAAVLDFKLEAGDETTVKGKIFKVISVLQLFRYVILIWNIIIMVMMLW